MFNEENTVEQMVLDTLCGGLTSNMVAEELPRQHSDVLVESMVSDALIRLNPEIEAQTDCADEVLYHLQTNNNSWLPL
jgi:type I restriction enzyme R subunit